MESNQTNSAPVAKLGEHHYNMVKPEQLAEIFGKPVEAAETAKRRSESQLATFYDLLVNSDDHLAKLVKRPTEKEKAELPVIDNKPRPLVVKALVDKGYAVGSAETIFSNMIRMREAYSKVQYIPPQGSTWEDAYKAAAKAMNVATRQRTQEAQKNKAAALRGAYIAQSMERLKPEEMSDPVKLAEAAKQGIEAAQKAARARKISDAAVNAFNAVGPQLVPELIDKLNALLKDWQTKQSSQTVAPAEVPAAQEENAQTAQIQPHRAAA